MELAAKAGIPVRGYVSCMIVCPYDGPVEPDAVSRVTRSLIDMGCHEVSLGDTIGAGTPQSVSRALEAVLRDVSADRLAGHFHDTNDNALGNVKAALALGLRTFDSAVGGLGGCPYAPGAKGNVSTSALVAMLESEGFDAGIDQSVLARAEQHLGHVRRDEQKTKEVTV